MARDTGYLCAGCKCCPTPKWIANPARLWNSASSKHSWGLHADLLVRTRGSLAWKPKAELCSTYFVGIGNDSDGINIFPLRLVGACCVPCRAVMEVKISGS